MAATADGWGEWMGGWKESEGQVDVEAERIDRQKAAMGGEMLGRMKDLNILILGARGVGVECAKNLILSNVGSVTLYDPNPTRIMDLGCNFYLNQDNVFAGTPRAEGCLPQLQTLNPYCKVEAHKGELNDEFLLQKNVLATGKPFGVVIVTDLLPRDQLFHINDLCRGNGMAFILGFNTGITASVFSDFGPKHIITDATGEPTQMLAVGNCEVIPKPPIMKVLDDKGQDVEDGTPVVVISVAQAKHGLDSGDEVVFDDMRGPLEILNGKQVSVKRCEFLSPREAKLDTNDPSFNEILKSATLDVMATFTKQYDHYKAEWEADSANADKKFPVREIQMFNRVAIVPPEGISAEQLAGYVAGGLMQQVRPPIEESYSSLKETLVQTKNPALLKGEDWTEGKGIDIHLALAATLDFEAEHKRWPALHSDDDATWVFERAGALSKERESVEGACWAEAFSWGFPSGEARDLDEKRIRRFAKLFPAELTGFCAYLGGVLAQEAVKRTGKFSPIKQWVHHEDTHLVTDESPTNVSPLLGTRYDWQVAVLGKDFQARAANQRVFLVGCGALGCEYLKGISLMGIGVGKRGKVWVTDMDQIEVSNLSRQFLFRSENVGQPKSVAGAAVVKGWNKALNIEALERKVGPDTEDFFSDEFWEGLDVCWNALDNVLARKYTDSRCLWYSKPLLESGTLGTKCNSEVILPFRSSTYNDGTETDDNENQIAMCTLRSFPYLPLHCIEFAKQAYFSDYFEFGPEQYDLYRSDKDTFFEQLDTMNEVEQMKAMSLIKYYAELQAGGAAIDFDACIRIAFDRLIKDFRTSVLDLIHQCDEMEKASGKVFWTGTKRKPRAVDWTSSDPSPMEYLYATANLFAHIWGVPYVRSRAEFQARVQKVGLVQPEWAPSGTKVMTEEDQADGEEGVSQEALYEVRGFLTELDVSKLQKAQAHDFEKDDDSNYHIDFLTIATNLRAWNYDIKASERHTVKVTAGKIIPALATTTAAVCGLVDIEFCKLVLGLQNLGNECFLNSNLNLSGSMMQAFQPEAPKEIKTGLAAPQSFTSWDKIIIDGEIPLKALIGLLEQRFGVKVTHLKRQGDQKTLFDAVDLKKLTWQITLKDGKVELSDDAIFTWKPQLRMARDMLSRLAADSGPAQTFKGQVNQAIAALEDVKASFQSTYDGPVSAAFSSAYRPSDDKPEDQAYFDTLLAARKYCVIEGYFVNAEGQDVTLPPIKYTFY